MIRRRSWLANVQPYRHDRAGTMCLIQVTAFTRRGARRAAENTAAVIWPGASTIRVQSLEPAGRDQ